MTKPVGFLRVSPLKFVEQIVWFFSFWLVCYLVSIWYSLLFGHFICYFFQYIFVYSFIYYSLNVIMGIFLAQAL